jgi:hypothetical protein
MGCTRFCAPGGGGHQALLLDQGAAPGAGPIPDLHAPGRRSWEGSAPRPAVATRRLPSWQADRRRPRSARLRRRRCNGALGDRPEGESDRPRAGFFCSFGFRQSGRLAPQLVRGGHLRTDLRAARIHAEAKELSWCIKDHIPSQSSNRRSELRQHLWPVCVEPEMPFAGHGLELGIGKPPGEARYGLERHVAVLAAVPAGFERTRRWCARGCGRQNIDVGSSSARSLSIGHVGQPLL